MELTDRVASLSAASRELNAHAAASHRDRSRWGLGVSSKACSAAARIPTNDAALILENPRQGMHCLFDLIDLQLLGG